MNKKVCVSIRGLHNSNPEDEDDSIEVVNIGTYAFRNGKHWVRYEEPIENTDEISTSLLKFSEREMEIQTKGQVASHLVFTVGQKNVTYYETPFGGMNMGVDTSSLEIVEEENKITLDVNYGLEINLGHVSNCKVHIEIIGIEEGN